MTDHKQHDDDGTPTGMTFVAVENEKSAIIATLEILARTGPEVVLQGMIAHAQAGLHFASSVGAPEADIQYLRTMLRGSESLLVELSKEQGNG